MERRHAEAILIHISSACGAPEGHHVPSKLRLGDDGVARRWETSLARSYYIENHNAYLAQGARHPGPDWAGKDQLHYNDSDPDNHG
jgi:hypothetical protein